MLDVNVLPTCYAHSADLASSHAARLLADARAATPQVQLVLGEMGVTLVDRASGEVVNKHSYTEIASCGRRNDRLRYFAYVAGSVMRRAGR